jgi:hypothetical protein
LIIIERYYVSELLPLADILFIPQMVYEFGERRCNDISTGERRRTRRKTCPSATSSTTNPTDTSNKCVHLFPYFPSLKRLLVSGQYRPCNGLIPRPRSPPDCRKTRFRSLKKRRSRFSKNGRTIEKESNQKVQITEEKRRRMKGKEAIPFSHWHASND